jgi:CHAD domain-containing protein
MTKYLPETEASSLVATLAVDPARAEHAARNAIALFNATGHLHGLTKTQRPLVEAAALVSGLFPVTQEPDPSRISRVLEAVKRQASSVASVGAKVLPQALGLLGSTDGEPGGSELGIVPRRIAAILRMVDALDTSSTQGTELVGVWDGGTSVELLVAGGESVLRDAGATLSEAGNWNRQMPRPVRAVKVWDRAEPPLDLLTPRHTLAEAMARIRQRQVEQFVNRAYGLRDASDIEYVHEMRVALRRLRAAARLFRNALGDEDKALKADAKRFAKQLGVVRDLDVFIEFLRHYIEGLPAGQRPFVQHLIRAEQGKRRRARVALIKAFESKAFETFKRRYAGAPLALTQGGKAERRVAEAAPRMLARALRSVTQDPRALYQYAPNELHRLRIRCKRLRYTGEFLADLYPNRLDALVTPAEAMQESLGLIHDMDVYTERIVVYAERRRSQGGDPSESNAVDALIGHLVSLRREALGQARSVWKAFRNRKTQDQISQLISNPRTL